MYLYVFYSNMFMFPIQLYIYSMCGWVRLDPAATFLPNPYLQ